LSGGVGEQGTAGKKRDRKQEPPSSRARAPWRSSTTNRGRSKMPSRIASHGTKEPEHRAADGRHPRPKRSTGTIQERSGRSPRRPKREQSERPSPGPLPAENPNRSGRTCAGRSASAASGHPPDLCRPKSQTEAAGLRAGRSASAASDPTHAARHTTTGCPGTGRGLTLAGGSDRGGQLERPPNPRSLPPVQGKKDATARPLAANRSRAEGGRCNTPSHGPAGTGPAASRWERASNHPRSKRPVSVPAEVRAKRATLLTPHATP